MSSSSPLDRSIYYYNYLRANGCGKTSIIEALKFCCTGSLPPNAKNGHAFINDPGVTDSTEVKASIKLRFKNKRGQDAVVVRSLQVLRKKSKLEYKALEGVIRMKSEAGEMVSLSHKCSELDKHIPELLGVSAAVMESVIFCHQEESSWPLAECAVLKKKFDDIFESTRFAKALEAIAKTKKDYAAKAKDMKCDVVELGGYLSTNTDDLRRRGVCQEKKDQYDEETATILETVARLDDKIARANEVLHRVGQAQGELRDLEWQERTAGIRVSERNAALESIVEGSEEELENSVNSPYVLILVRFTLYTSLIHSSSYAA